MGSISRLKLFCAGNDVGLTNSITINTLSSNLIFLINFNPV